MTFLFLQPRSDGSIAQATIDAPSIEEAFPRYALNYWKADEEAAIVVYQGNNIIGRIVSEYSPITEGMMAVFRRI